MNPTLKATDVAVDDGGELTASVSVEFLDQPNGIPALRVTAVCGSTTVEHTHALAPVDGAHAELADDHVQTAVDDCRMRAARKAVMIEGLKAQIAAAT